MICTLYTIGHGREPRVFWGIDDARGRRLAQERDVTEALILMGDWCGAWSRRHGNENTDASEMAKRGWSVPSGTQREKMSKVVEGRGIAS